MDLLAGLPVVMAVAFATGGVLGLPGAYPLQVLAVYAAAAVLILRAVPPALPGPGSGPANRITLGRMVLVVALVPLVLHGGALGETERWWVVGAGTVAMALDGVDGWLARRTGTSTAFGARFDMETDAFLMLVLSGLVLAEGQAGAWVVLIGAMRYLFVAAGRIWPALRGELFPSFRRKAVCVIQGAALLVCLAPVVPPAVAAPVAAVALVALAGSFAVDTAWLARRGNGGDSRIVPARERPTPPVSAAGT